MLDYTKYFKDQKSFYEFVLKELDAKDRNKLLKVEYKHFSSKTARQSWYKEIRNNIDDNIAIEVLNKMLSDMEY